MADRKSAALFGTIFEFFSEFGVDDELKQKMWNLRTSYDFNDYQMGVDDALIKLGLAEKGDDGYVIYNGSE